MTFITKLSNTLNNVGTRLYNAVDRRLGTIGVGLTDSQKSGNLKDLTNLQIVNRTLENSRIAVEIDPTTWSSILSIIIIANNKIEVQSTPDANPDAVSHIQDKIKTWNLDEVIDEYLWKSILDGECFLKKTVGPDPEKGQTTIQSLDFLLYDEDSYDFIEIKDPLTGEVAGYKQKAIVVEYPRDWKNKTFDELKNWEGEEKEFDFEPWEVVNPKLTPQDGHGQSWVFKVLDYVYIKKYIENLMPVTAKRAGVTLGIEVGNSDVEFKFGDEATDTYEMKKSKVDKGLEILAENFAEKEKKDTISHPYGIRPYMIGTGQIVDYTPFLEYVKQEIRTALLTPDSRFESSSSNRAVAQEQMGEMGQGAVIGYFRDFVKVDINPQIINFELELAGYIDDIDKVWIDFKETKVEDEMSLATIGEKLVNMGLDKKAILSSYFKRLIADNPDFLKDLEKKEKEDETGEYVPEDETNPTEGGGESPLTDPELNVTSEEVKMVNSFKKLLNWRLS